MVQASAIQYEPLKVGINTVIRTLKNS
ncbi:hypothetical protein DLB95_09085 [Salmonella enterica subsp. diarizonae]|uniref:Insertion element IS1 protein InsA helix-turn-helix domain-containing protein n=2 Tax=Salmonella enterica TaxID=28901 RepID=A0A759RRH5_SALER|nr:hypothetical protein [Salmonella enterica subsp. diarizonae]EBS8367009.1 hypothetical protein [Salmonella enterica]EEH1956558.1 hypothetical protein [Salmonella enterica subsp. diarizonae serovar 61:k:1,5,(7)]EEN6160380.1 hypothetical protein [Salmonella enterica subsp. enterica]EFU9619546.1 hypothetical protein [Salmonella enterica subsp. enterica serovar Dublin]EGH6322064.1 hypothetical protein [Salmonella enterica subsp. enterica serovar Stanley]EHB8790595.1 hypothetical protein [Salmon